MTYEFVEALQRALNVLRGERAQKLLDWKRDEDNIVKKTVYETYRDIIDKLDSLI